MVLNWQRCQTYSERIMQTDGLESNEGRVKTGEINIS